MSQGSPLARSARGALALAVTLMAFLGIGAPAALAAPPTVTIEPASEVGVTSALAKGEVNPEGIETNCRFDYVTDAQFQIDEWASAAQAGCNVGGLTGNSPQTVEGTLENLTPGETYHLRLVAENVQAEQGIDVAPNFATDAATAPTLALAPATGLTGTSAVLHGSIDPEGGNENPLSGPTPIFWQLQYAPASEPGNWQMAFIEVEPPSPIEGAQALSDSPIEVKATTFGQQPGEHYNFRLVASYAGGEATPAEGGEFVAPAVAPEVTETHAVSVGEETATVTAHIRPGGAPTTYHFEYVTQAAFEATGFASAISTPESASLGSDNSKHLAEAALAGLELDTSYRFRAVATNSVATVVGVDRGFHTAPAETPAEADSCPNAARRSETGSTALPNCRAWEMVSPPEKNGGQVAVGSARTRVTPDCTTDCAANFFSLSGFAGTVGGAVATEYISERAPESGGNGWRTHAINPPQDSLSFGTVTAYAEPYYVSEFSADLDTAVFRAFSPLTDDPYVANQINLYVRSGLRDGVGSSRLVSSCPFCADTPLPNWNGNINSASEYAAHTSDFEHVLFQSELDLTGVGSEMLRLYESGPAGVHLVGFVPPGDSASCGGGGPACVLPSESSVAGLAGVRWSGKLPHVLSADGTRVNFTTTPDPTGVARPGDRLFQRNSQGTATLADDTTIQLDAPERSSNPRSEGTAYMTASADGHRVFFKTIGNLTDDTPVLDGTQIDHLYMWHDDFLNDEVQKLTVKATAGQFRLILDGQETADLPFDATPGQVGAALEALPAIQADDGRIAVSGGTGDETGTTPYTITFEGGLAETNVPTLSTAPGTSALSGGDAAAEVAPWVKGGGHLTLIDVDREPADSSSAIRGFGVHGVVGASTDGHYVYFMTTSQLLPGGPLIEPDEGQRGAALYLWHDGSIREVGNFPFSLSLDYRANVIHCMTTGFLAVNPCVSSAAVSPDGKSLLFSARDGSGLTGYDHGTIGCTSLGTESHHPTTACNEAYLYHADSDQLRCASCNPTSQAAGADVVVDEVYHATGFTLHDTKHQAHTLSDDGRFAFFSTREALVPGDTNGVFDAYEYDSSTERIHLLSSGTSKDPSFFVEASADGSDVFIATSEQLSGWDVDSVIDLYDARAGGGILEPVPTSAPCSGDSCTPAPAPAPVPPPVASESFAGPQNPKPPRCRRGRRAVRTAGKTRCVSRKGHHKQKRSTKQKRDANHERRTGR